MKFFKKFNRKNGNKGSTLIAVLVVTTILSLFMMTIIPIMGNYAQGSVYERYIKQADFSARSANDAIVAGILVNKDENLIDGINNIAKGGSLSLKNFVFSKTEMGNKDTIEAVISRLGEKEDNRFKVTTMSTFVYGINKETGETRTISRKISREISKTTVVSGSTIQALPGFYVDSIIAKRSYVSTTGTSLSIDKLTMGASDTLSIGKDLIIYNTISINNKSKITMSGGINNNNDIYTNNGKIEMKKGQLINYKGVVNRTSNVKVSNVVNLAPDQKFNQPTTWNPTNTTDIVYTGAPKTMTVSGGKRYRVSSTFTCNSIDLADTTTSSPAYIVVETGKTFTISNKIGTGTEAPKVFFTLEGNAKLIVATGSSIAVYGGDKGTNINITGTNPTLNGHVRVGSITSSTYPITMNYIIDPTSGGSTTKDTWSAGAYSK